MNSPEEILDRVSTITRFPIRDVLDLTPKSPVPILSSAEFVASFKPPDYLIDGILQRGFLYSMCGRTGHAKTAVALRLLAAVAMGREVGGKQTQKGRALMLVGENPDDVMARWIALGEQMGFDTHEIEAYFVPGIFPITTIAKVTEEHAKRVGELAMIVVDTSAAYFPGDDENSNTELLRHAQDLRTFTKLSGRPTVIVNCHPVKNGSLDNLVPRGGGAFLNEVDGNLTCVKTDNVVEVHYQAKFRGTDFQPLYFEIVTVESSVLVSSKGRPVPTVIARPITETERTAKEENASRDQDKLLRAMADNPGASTAKLAKALGWLSVKGEPLKGSVSKRMKRLAEDKLVRKVGDTWTVTEGGSKLLKLRDKAASND